MLKKQGEETCLTVINCLYLRLRILKEGCHGWQPFCCVGFECLILRLLSLSNRISFWLCGYLGFTYRLREAITHFPQGVAF
jgi:hypothetical protein